MPQQSIIRRLPTQLFDATWFDEGIFPPWLLLISAAYVCGLVTVQTCQTTRLNLSVFDSSKIGFDGAL